MKGTLPLDSFIADYRLVDFLGAGNMGEVYRAVHPKIGRVVAVKVLTHPDYSSNNADRFFNEAAIHASLHHQGIVTLYDFIEWNGRPCIIMEYIDGQTLDERLRQCGPPPVSEAIGIFQDVVEAVGYLHRQGVIHRDIKASNIMISSVGQVKLLDFGIAKAETTPRLTMTGHTVGTLEYISPEQLISGSADARSDIWSLSVLLYEMVTGGVPFEAPTVGELCRKITNAVFTSPSILNPAVPREIEAVITRGLKKNPAQRYQSTQQLLADLKHATAQASTPDFSLLETKRSTKDVAVGWAKRNWPIFSAAMLAMLVLTIGAGSLISKQADHAAATIEQTSLAAAPPSAAPVANKGTSRLRTVRVTIYGDSAKVFLYDKSTGETYQGETPFKFEAALGERRKYILRREDSKDEPVDITVSEANLDWPRVRMRLLEK